MGKMEYVILTKEDALGYLALHGYEDVDNFPYVSYKKGTGDGSWEKVAYENYWAPKEKNLCCYKFEKQSALLKKCFFCGTGIHDTVSWVLEEDDENLQSLLRGMDVNKIYKGKGRMKEFELTDEPMMPLFSEEPIFKSTWK